MSEKIVELRNVSFSYGINKVLEDISLYIKKGDFVGIIGPNGSAKSTLLKLMVGLLKADIGTIYLFNKPVNEFKEFYKIGYISQTAREFNNMFPATVEEVVAANIYNKNIFSGKIKREEKTKVEEVLQIVEMSRFRKKKIGDLSGGQKQRIFIARALVNNPEILFMDEPLVGVDIKSQSKFYRLLDRINEEFNITLVIVSHDIGVISKKVNRLFCLSNGKVYEHDLKTDKNINLKGIYGENVNLLFHQHWEE
ncbi:MAG: metal ABC transporter ATP-binding protein [Tissierellia bacterium]|nr:metal ABC transporter ATP-binding protein [Tissierellia bacterium]